MHSLLSPSINSIYKYTTHKLLSSISVFGKVSSSRHRYVQYHLNRPRRCITISYFEKIVKQSVFIFKYRQRYKQGSNIHYNFTRFNDKINNLIHDPDQLQLSYC